MAGRSLRDGHQSCQQHRHIINQPIHPMETMGWGCICTLTTLWVRSRRTGSCHSTPAPLQGEKHRECVRDGNIPEFTLHIWNKNPACPIPPNSELSDTAALSSNAINGIRRSWASSVAVFYRLPEVQGWKSWFGRAEKGRL